MDIPNKTSEERFKDWIGQDYDMDSEYQFAMGAWDAQEQHYSKLREVAESMAEALKFVLKDNEHAMMYEGIGSESTSKIETALQCWHELTQNKE